MYSSPNSITACTLCVCALRPTSQKYVKVVPICRMNPILSLGTLALTKFTDVFHLLCAVLCSYLLWLAMKPFWLGTCFQQAKAKCKQVMSLLICTFLTTKSMSCALNVLLCMMFRKSYMLSMCSAAKRMSSEAKSLKSFLFFSFLSFCFNEWKS